MISNIDIENGRLRSIAVRTETAQFLYSYYDKDNAVALFMTRKLDSEQHRRTIDAFVKPDVAKKLIDAFIAGKEKEGEEREIGGLWKRVLDVADVIASGISESASARIGSNVTRHNGIVVTLGYELEGDQYRVFADAEWREGEFTCRAYEGDMVPQQDIKNLKYYTENVLFFIEQCL